LWYGNRKEIAAKNSMKINDITYQINGAVYEVNRVLGAGFLEKVYENALLIELQERGLKAESQVQVEVNYKGRIVGAYFADIVVEDVVILELKSVNNLSKSHEAQILNYLMRELIPQPKRAFSARK